jgi:peptidoglycan glycosyltransferase
MSLDPFTKYRPMASGRSRRAKWLSFRATVLLLILLSGLLMSKTPLLNQYNYYMGMQHWRQDKLELSRLEFQKALDRAPGDPRAIDGLGLVEMKAGRMVKAKTIYDQAMKAGLRANRRMNHLATGKDFLDKGRYAEAQFEFEHALELQPNKAEIHAALGTALRAQGQVVNGVKSYEKALALDPKDRNIQLLLEQGREERDRGAIYYIFDRNGQPLAQMWYKTGERGYPFGKECAHLLGWVDNKEVNNRGTTGLEKVFQDQFPGNKLYLTLDARVQRLLMKAMGWQKGAIVVINPRTGEILGAVSQPTFTPEKVHEDWWKYIGNSNKPLFHRAFEGLYEPGSIIKIITSAAALEKNVDLKNIFPLNIRQNYRYYDGKVFYDWKRHGVLKSLEEAFDTSSNIAYAELGFLLGNDVLFEFFNRFGFNNHLKTLPIPVSVSVSPKLGLSKYELAEASTGLGRDFKITPLGGSLIASAIANDGVLMSPYLVSRVTNIEGKVLEQRKPQVLQKAVNRHVARAMTGMMVNDVERGIGAKARVKAFQVAGKTGTSGSRNPNFHAWFICFAPAENPKIAMAILAEHGGTGKDVAAPIARVVLEGMADIIDSFGPAPTKK